MKFIPQFEPKKIPNRSQFEIGIFQFDFIVKFQLESSQLRRLANLSTFLIRQSIHLKG